MPVHEQDLTWDRVAFPLGERDQFRVEGGQGWRVLRTSDDIVYGFSGPAPQGDLILTFTLPTPLSASKERGWRQGVYLSIWNLLKPQVYADPLPLDVPLAAVLAALPDELVDVAVSLHDRYTDEAQTKLHDFIDIAHEAAQAHKADPELREDGDGTVIGLAAAANAMNVSRQLRNERAAVKELLRMRSRRNTT